MYWEVREGKFNGEKEDVGSERKGNEGWGG